jgi:hypothetical protein
MSCHGFFPVGYKEFGSLLITTVPVPLTFLAKPGKELKR